MHDARAMQQVANISQVMYNIHPSNLIPPTHVFNGEFLFLGFWSGPQYQQGILSTDEHANLSKHRNNISKYKSLAQSLLAQDECSPNELLKYGLGLL